MWSGLDFGTFAGINVCVDVFQVFVISKIIVEDNISVLVCFMTIGPKSPLGPGNKGVLVVIEINENIPEIIFITYKFVAVDHKNIFFVWNLIQRTNDP